MTQGLALGGGKVGSWLFADEGVGPRAGGLGALVPN